MWSIIILSNRFTFTLGDEVRDSYSLSLGLLSWDGEGSSLDPLFLPFGFGERWRSLG